MPPPARDGMGNNSRPTRGPFPGFPDAFAGFPNMSFFDSDPFFTDPFFMRPFNFGSNGLFGPSDPFGSSGLFGGFPSFFDQSQGRASLMDRRENYHGERNRRDVQIGEGSRRGVHIQEFGNDHDVGRNGHSRGVRIEELPDDHDMVRNGQQSSNQEPVVEHPDDDEKAEAFNQQPSSTISANARRQSRGGMPSSNNFGGQTYSFQSSSVMYGGSNGPYYAAQTSRRQGPGGVFEEEHQEKNSTTGKEMHRQTHGLGERGYSVTRKRNGGREENFETLHNINPEEVQDFEKTWTTAADKNLPKRTKSGFQRLGSSSRAQPAAQSNGQRSIGWKADK